MTPDFYINGITQVKAYRILQAHVAAVVKGYGFGSVSEWFVLSHVYTKKQVMAKDLAALLEVEAPLITRLINSLIASKLVAITPHETDKRVKYVRPTERGLLLVPQVQAALGAVVADLLTGTSKTDLKAYEKVLKTIIVNGEKT